MKVIDHTATQLTIVDQNRQWFWGTLFSAPFIIVGTVIALTTSNITTLECQRSSSASITCERTIVGFAGTRTEAIPGRLLRASVIRAHGTGVVLATSKGGIDLVNHRMTVTDAHSQIANTINAYVKDSQQRTLKVQQDDRLEGMIYAAAFFLPGVAILLQSLAIPMQVVCVFDKTVGQMTLEKRYRPLGTRFRAQYQLTEVQKAYVVQPSLSERHPKYVVRLELAAAKSIALSPLMKDRQQCQTIANTINHFLAVHPI
jgi:hypothetical protein